MSAVPGPTVARPSIAGPGAAAEIDAFGAALDRFRAGRIPAAVFLENRLRHGVYGQRQDGVHMMRSKLPLGLMSPDQLEAFADVAETWGHGLAHLTTRQNIQIHFVPLEQTPAVMRVLDRARMTAREACGNVVRNVTANPLAGVLPGSAFDVTAPGFALAQALLRHPEGQSLGRKVKIHLTDVDDPRFDLSRIHDTGLRAVLRPGPAGPVRGYHVRVGGGLGAVPHEAPVLTEFLPEAELIPFHVALLRVFGRLGEKRKRARARLKFLVQKLGVDGLRAELARERAALRPDPSWAGFAGDPHGVRDAPRHGPSGALPDSRDLDEDSRRWVAGNIVQQDVPGHVAVQVRVPRGDLSPAQLRGLAAVLREEVGDTLRIGPDQSLWLRSVAADRALGLRDRLRALGLGDANAGGLGDTVTCPGADTCKLGITSPRALARQLQPTLDRLAAEPRLAPTRVHVSGCPNSCSQHQTADIGFFGAAKTRDGVTAPHFVLMMGGEAGGAGTAGPGTGFATSILKLPAGRVDQAIERLGALYTAEAAPGESWGGLARRLGRARLKALLADLAVLPGPAEAPALYREHGQDATPFAVRRGTGECAGEVVDQTDLLLADADTAADRMLDAFARGADDTVAHSAAALDRAVRALLALDGTVDPPDPVAAFRTQVYEAGRIFEGVGHHLLAAAAEDAAGAEIAGDRLRRRVEETALFVEEVHSIVGRIRSQAGGAAVGGGPLALGPIGGRP